MGTADSSEFQSFCHIIVTVYKKKLVIFLLFLSFKVRLDLDVLGHVLPGNIVLGVEPRRTSQLNQGDVLAITPTISRAIDLSPAARLPYLF
jgi:hypothetical protein